MFNKVLVATDLLEACDAAVLTALEIAKQNNGEFYILHVLESDSTIYRQFVKHFKTGEEIVSDEAYEKKVKKEIESKCAAALKPSSHKYYQADFEADLHSMEKKLEALCEDIPDGVECEYGVWGGALPHLEIEKYADKQNVDLIIMGSHTKEKSGKWYVGSAMERVSLRSICPVIVVTDPKALLSMDG